MGYRVAIACIFDLLKDYDEIVILVAGRSFMEYLSEFLAFRGKTIRLSLTRISPDDCFFIKEFFAVNSSIDVSIELFGSTHASTLRCFDAVVGGMSSGGLIEYGMPQHREAGVCYYSYVTKSPTFNMNFSHTIGIVINSSGEHISHLEAVPNPQVVSCEIPGAMELFFGIEAPAIVGGDASAMLMSAQPCEAFGVLQEGSDCLYVSPTRCEIITRVGTSPKMGGFRRVFLYLKNTDGYWDYGGTIGFVAGGNLLPIPPGVCLSNSPHSFTRCEGIQARHLLIYPAMLSGAIVYAPSEADITDTPCSCGGSVHRLDANYGRLGVSVNTCGCKEFVYSDPVQGGAVQFELKGAVKEFPYQMTFKETNAFPCVVKTLPVCPAIRCDLKLEFSKLCSVPRVSAVGEMIVVINRHSFDQLTTMSLNNESVRKEVSRLSLLARMEYQRANLIGVLDCNESIRSFCAENSECQSEVYLPEKRSFVTDVSGIFAVFGNNRARKRFIAFKEDQVSCGKWSVAPLELLSGQG
jgi:hypothetical protein